MIYFIMTHRQMLVHGAGIYVNKNLKAIFRSDLKFNMLLVESCWIELDTGINKPNVMIGCIYRHPAANFYLILQKNLKEL